SSIDVDTRLTPLDPRGVPEVDAIEQSAHARHVLNNKVAPPLEAPVAVEATVRLLRRDAQSAAWAVDSLPRAAISASGLSSASLHRYGPPPERLASIPPSAPLHFLSLRTFTRTRHRAVALSPSEATEREA